MTRYCFCQYLSLVILWYGGKPMNLFQVAMISAVLLFVALSTALYAWLSRRHLMRLLQNEIVSASAAKRAKGSIPC